MTKEELTALIAALAAAKSPAECKRLRAELNAYSHYWNDGRSYPPHVRTQLHAHNLSVDPRTGES